MSVSNSLSRCNRIEPFPFCELHERSIVTDFPAGCPFRESNPLTAILAFKDQGFRELGKNSYHAGNVLLRVGDTCHDCTGRLIAHPHVKWLRTTGGYSNA